MKSLGLGPTFKSQLLALGQTTKCDYLSKEPQGALFSLMFADDEIEESSLRFMHPKENCTLRRKKLKFNIEH